MPKRGKGSRSWRNSPSFDDFGGGYYDHDDRVSVNSGDITRRVSFKGGNRITKHGRHSDPGLPHNRVRLLTEDDIDMAGGTQIGSSRHGSNAGRYGTFAGSRGNRMKRGRGRGGPVSSHSRQKLQDQTGYFKVYIPHGTKSEKSILMGVLRSHLAPMELVPIAFKEEGQDIMFYVDELKVAEKLLEADRKIVVNSGFRLSLRVTSIMPRVDVTDVLKERIKMAMVRRYNNVTKALDLSRFHLDPDLVENSFCAVARPQVLSAVLEIISEHIPELQALNLGQNCLFVPEYLSQLNSKVPHLRILYLGKNRFRDLSCLSSLKDLELVELELEGNPMYQRCEDRAKFISKIRKTFPKLTKLDGVELPPKISFEVEESVRKIPQWQGSFLCAVAGRDVIRPFVEQYFGLYDSEDRNNRQLLMAAYHDNAMFSISSTYPPGQSTSTGPKLNTYISESRNLMRISDPERRHMMLHNGKVDIVKFLCELPRSEHDPTSFAVDLNVFSQHLISLSLSGVFREPGFKIPPLRSFHRLFVLVPVGSGFCIINEQLFVTNTTPSQHKKAFAPRAPVVASPSLPTPSLPAQVVPVQGDALAAQQQQIVICEALAQQTGMNLEWSRKCLIETQWDPQRALLAFAELNGQGRVPAEAFIK